MGINIAIRETECQSALCREMKLKTVRVLVGNPEEFGEAAEIYRTVSKQCAVDAVGDWTAFLKRNKLSKDTDIVHIDLLTDGGDLTALEPLSERRFSGWVDFEGLGEDSRKEALKNSLPENRTTEWELISFDEMRDTCARCPVSWDKGRGCIGSFGPDDSLLPGIAAKHGCAITASVPEGAASHRIYAPEEAAELLKEVETLRKALPEEGKMMVRRYSGPVDRMEAVAKICVEEGCGLYFF
jgi:hypothetical protein